MGSILILFGLAGLAAGLLGLASLAKGSLRLLRIGSRKPAAVAGIAFVACLAGGACTGPPQKAVPAKATLPAPAVPLPSAVTATPAPVPTIIPSAAPATVAPAKAPATVGPATVAPAKAPATVAPAPVPAPPPAASQSPATSSSSSSSSSGATCGQDSYVNVDGNCVHRPVSSSSAPAGATAQCADGTYSFSQHRSGTCSHHGGVAAWL